MRKLLAAALVFVASSALGDERFLGVTINPGTILAGRADVRVFNATSERIASVFAHCTFRDSTGARIDSVPVYVANLSAGDVAKEVARMPNDIKASAVECRLESVTRN